MNDKNSDILFNATQTAQKIGVSLPTLDNWKKGKIQLSANKKILLPVKDNKGNYTSNYRQEDIDNYLLSKGMQIEYFGTAQTAKRINIKVYLLHRWDKNPQKYSNIPILLPSKKHGDRKLYHEQAIKEYLQVVKETEEFNIPKAKKLLQDFKAMLGTFMKRLEEDGY